MNETDSKQKTVVIVGGGFGGVTAMVQLSKHIKYGGPEMAAIKIILIDRKDYHLYYPNIYEVAAAEEEFVSVAALKKSVALPFREIVPAGAQFIQGDLEEVNHQGNYVKVKTEAGSQQVPYDYLVLALGSVTDFVGIPGARENSLTLAGLNDALKIRNAVEFLIQSHRMDVAKKPLRILIGGGGFTGTELVSELLNLVEILSWKYNYPLDKLELMVIEGASQLMPGQPSYIASTIYHRLRSFGVNILLGNVITKVDKSQVTLSNGEVFDYDLFFWTGGVKSASVPFAEKVETDRKGRAMTAADLSLKGSRNIFMVGDDACVMDSSQRPMPQTATQAIDHAKYVAGVIAAQIAGQQPKNHSCQPSPFIVPVRGKWAIMHFPSGFTMQGFLPWLAKSYAAVRYFSSLMPLGKAVKHAWFEEELYTRND